MPTHLRNMDLIESAARRDSSHRVAAANRRTLSASHVDHNTREYVRPKTAHEERLDARLARDKYLDRSGGYSTTTSAHRMPDFSQFPLDTQIPPWQGTRGQPSPAMKSSPDLVAAYNSNSDSAPVWTGTDEDESSQSHYSPSTPVSPKTAMTVSSRTSTDGSESHKRKKKLGWNMLGGMLHRKDTMPSAPKVVQRARGDTLLCGSGPHMEEMMQDGIHSLAMPGVPIPEEPSSPIPSKMQHSRKISAQVPRGLTRFEARAQADRVSFAQNPYFATPPTSSVLRKHQAVARHGKEDTSRTSKQEEDRADSFVSVSERKNSALAGPQLRELELSAKQISERHDSVASDTQNSSRLTILERRQSKPKRIMPSTDLAACVEEEHEPPQLLMRAPGLTPDVLSALDDPEDYINAVEARLKESREKLGRSMPRLRPMQRAVTAPSLASTYSTLPSPADDTSEISADTLSVVSSGTRQSADDVLYHAIAMPPPMEQQNEPLDSPPPKRHPNPLFSHPPTPTKLKPDIDSGSYFEHIPQARSINSRTSSFSSSTRSSSLSASVRQRSTPPVSSYYDEAEESASDTSLHGHLPRTSSLQAREHAVVQVRMARQISVRAAQSTARPGPGAHRLRPVLLDLSKDHRSEGSHVVSPN